MTGKQNLLQEQLGNHIRPYLMFEHSIPTTGVTNVLGNWSVAWGPVVFQDEGSSVADNAMLVAHSHATFPDGSAKSTYVVAIAGTAAESTTDWSKEDGISGTGEAITSVVSWDTFVHAPTTTPDPHPAAGEAVISLGTATGLCHLLAMKDPVTGASLRDFVAGLRADVLVVTGHSLGGALSPALGLYLIKSKATSGIDTTYVYSTAGATPGNDAFAKAFADHLPPEPRPQQKPLPPLPPGTQPWQCWNYAIWNTLDVVPQAWSTAPADSTQRTINNVNIIYGNNDEYPTPEDVRKLSARLCGWSTTAPATYTTIEGVSFTGSPVTQISDTDPKKIFSIKKPPRNFLDFAAQALHQHGAAYHATILAGTPTIDGPETELLPGVKKETIPDLLVYFAGLFKAKLTAEEEAHLAALR